MRYYWIICDPLCEKQSFPRGEYDCILQRGSHYIPYCNLLQYHLWHKFITMSIIVYVSSIYPLNSVLM